MKLSLLNKHEGSPPGNGFTLLEGLLVIALFTIILGLILPITFNARHKHAVRLTSEQVVSLLRTAQLKARSNEENDVWSVQLDSNPLILFKGSTVDTRDESFDLEFYIPAKVNVSGINNVTFTQDAGVPNISGDILVVGSQSSKTITIESNGVISY